MQLLSQEQAAGGQAPRGHTEERGRRLKRTGGGAGGGVGGRGGVGGHSVFFSGRSLKVFKAGAEGGVRAVVQVPVPGGAAHIPHNRHRPVGAWPAPTFPQPRRPAGGALGTCGWVSLDGAGPSPATAGEQEAGLRLDGAPGSPALPPSTCVHRGPSQEGRLARLGTAHQCPWLPGAWAPRPPHLPSGAFHPSSGLLPGSPPASAHVDWRGRPERPGLLLTATHARSLVTPAHTPQSRPVRLQRARLPAPWRPQGGCILPLVPSFLYF